MKKIVIVSLVAGMAIALLLGLMAVVVPGQQIQAWFGQQTHEPFPALDESHLSPDQVKLVVVLRHEYQTQANGTKYSEGVDEPWCADFVSWVYKEAGQPLKNPNSGSWRIPGTHTLREYFEKAGKFHTVDSGYMPKLGDIAIYDGPGWFGQHTNFILKYDGTQTVTIGGNEAGRVQVQTRAVPERGLVGYGEFPNESVAR